MNMTPSGKRKTLPDPRSKTGPFEDLLKDIQECKKADINCPSLKTRQFYFEPNSVTAPDWKKVGCFSEPIDYRVMFICESSGGSAREGNPEDPERCFYGSLRDRRFLEVRQNNKLANCYITNTVKCGVRRGGKHSRTEVEACREFLVREIDIIKPMIIVGVGENAFQTLRTEVLGRLKQPTPSYFRSPTILVVEIHGLLGIMNFQSYSGFWHGCVRGKNGQNDQVVVAI